MQLTISRPRCLKAVLTSVFSIKVQKVTKSDNTIQVNPLQPSLEQINELQKYEDVSQYLRSLKPSEWCKKIKPYKDLLYNGKSCIKISDQEERAKHLAKYIKDNKITEYTTMDGHGRMYFSLLSKLGSYADQLKIRVVDIDSTVNKWHELFFPGTVECVCGNIYDYKPTPDKLIYMNFCGIGGIKGQKMLAQYLNSIQPNNIINIFISFSTMRGATFTKNNGVRPDCERVEMWLPSKNYETNTWLSKYVKNYSATKLLSGPQNDFPTFLVTF